MNKLYHNPRCSKSRQTLSLLEENNAEFEIVEYLKNPPSESEISSILVKLGYSNPLQLIRTKEDLYKELGVDSFKDDSSKLIKTMTENPKLIERPILVTDQKAAVGRPPESVLEIL